MRIYRLELDGKGLYTSNLHLCLNDSGFAPRHTPPDLDPILKKSFYNNSDRPGEINWGYHFGFASIEDYNYWTEEKEVRSNMTKDGGILCVYEVPDDCCVLGTTQQAIFLMHKATLVNVFRPDHFDKE